MRAQLNTEVVAVRLPPDLRDRLEAVARREERSLAGVARRALRVYLADEEAGRGTGDGHEQDRRF
jgi:predicted transcriptional regulator